MIYNLNYEAINFRQAVYQDIQAILEIIENARKYLKQKGTLQWQNGYPNRALIQQDIRKGQSYLLELDNKIIATAAIIIGQDKGYINIQGGKWLTNSNNYLTIHRIAVSSELRRKGLASLIVKNAQLICRKNNILSIRADTFPQNKQMQQLFNKNGFRYCGIIVTLDGIEGTGFQKIII